jgi:hypothetical protein
MEIGHGLRPQITESTEDATFPITPSAMRADVRVQILTMKWILEPWSKEQQIHVTARTAMDDVSQTARNNYQRPTRFEDMVFSCEDLAPAVRAQQRRKQVNVIVRIAVKSRWCQIAKEIENQYVVHPVGRAQKVMTPMLESA